MRQHNGFYYVILINNRDSQNGQIPVGTDPQRAQSFVANPVTMLVPDNTVVTACEELTAGSTTPVAVPLTSVLHPTLGARQSVSVLSASTPLAAAAVRIFRFRIAHPAATVRTVLRAQAAVQHPSSGETAEQAEFGAASGERQDHAPQERVPHTLAVSVAPNPAAAEVTIRCALPSSERVQCTLYDLHGRMVAVPLPPVHVEAGVHTLPFDTRGLPAGVYSLMLHTSTTRCVTRLVIMH